MRIVVRSDYVGSPRPFDGAHISKAAMRVPAIPEQKRPGDRLNLDGAAISGRFVISVASTHITIMG
jgi:hypothetical protein